MKLDNINQPCLNTSLMGVIRGVMDYHEMKVSNGKAYGGSGHAFLINIHDVVCPSGPYCWKYDGFYRLLSNLGLKITDLGFYHKDSTMEDRRRVESIMREHLDAGRVCSMQNMDNQIVYGYDDKGFLLTQPWGPKVDVTPPTLTFTTWDEYGDEIHANYFAFQKIQPADDMTIIRDSLHYAIDLFKNPKKYEFEKYTIGAEAYDKWIAALKQDTANAHGNWWNATVWSECRATGAEYFREIAKTYEGDVSEMARELSGQYNDIASLLEQVSNKEKPSTEKISLLQYVKEKDTTAVQKIETFLRVFDRK
jgi:hypothetical protein